MRVLILEDEEDLAEAVRLGLTRAGWTDAPPGVPRARHAGLGPAIVRQIVEAHRGRVALHSEAGAGSTFVLWFPAPDRADDRPPPAHDPLPQSTPVRASGSTSSRSS